MTEHDQNEVTISAKFEKSGISIGARSRAIASVDRLIGNIATIPANFFGGIADRQAARNRVREKLIEAAGNIAVSEIESDKEIAKVFVDRIIQHDIRKLENKEAVVEKAIEFLSESRIEDVGQPEKSINSDWLNQFEFFAEQATSDSLREIWAQVLAGEIRRPNSFSRSTIRAIAELDIDIAKKFEVALRYRHSDQFLFQPKDLKGDLLMDFNFLEEEGFLQGAVGLLGIDIPSDANGNFTLICGDLILRAATQPNQKIRANLIRITRTGQEIASILPKPNYWDGLKEFGESIVDKCKFVYLSQILEWLPSNQIRYIDLATIKAEN